jgi:hypothetical protein
MYACWRVVDDSHPMKSHPTLVEEPEEKREVITKSHDYSYVLAAYSNQILFSQ